MDFSHLIGKFDFSHLTELFMYNENSPLLFNSGLFLFLFAAFAGIYALLKNKTSARLFFVICFSYYFYYKSSGFYFFLLAVVSLSDFIIGSFLGNVKRQTFRKMLVALSLIINLGLLCYFKYTNFLGEIFSNVFHDGKFQPYNIFLPVGISFFTFQSLSYTIDIYRQQIKPLMNPLDYFFYVSFFPQLVAGPIVRAKDFIPQIRKPLYVSREMFGHGLYLIMSGLFKKAVISDYISINFVDRIFDNPTLYSGVENLFGVYGYALQIYCDFSGYSDMAIGIALLLGFTFPLNFNSPYKSASITEFWKRWHISLSSWLKDYVYISFGGNRKGKIRQYINLMLTMLIGGLWHGAMLKFILWGGIHGLGLVVHKIWMFITRQQKGGKNLPLWRRIPAIFITFHFVCICWVFFRADNMDKAFMVLSQIVTSFNAQVFVQMITGYWGVFVLMLIGYITHFMPIQLVAKVSRTIQLSPLFIQALLIVLITYIVIQIKTADVQPFIYFQF